MAEPAAGVIPVAIGPKADIHSGVAPRCTSSSWTLRAKIMKGWTEVLPEGIRKDKDLHRATYNRNGLAGPAGTVPIHRSKTRSGLEPRAATLAVIEELTGVRRHRLGGCMTACRARNRRLFDNGQSSLLRAHVESRESRNETAPYVLTA